MCSHVDAEQAGTTETRRTTLQEPVPDDLTAGTVVEIDLLGNGLAGYYNRLLFDAPSSDADGVLVAAELLDRCLSELGDTEAARRSPAEREHWTSLVRRLSVAENLIGNHGAEGAGSLVLLLDQVRALLLSALRDDSSHSPTWSRIGKTLAQALDRCNDLADEATATIQQRRKHFETVTYGHLHPGDPQVNNHEDLVRGLHLATRLGLTSTPSKSAAATRAMSSPPSAAANCDRQRRLIAAAGGRSSGKGLWRHKLAGQLRRPASTQTSQKAGRWCSPEGSLRRGPFFPNQPNGPKHAANLPLAWAGYQLAADVHYVQEAPWRPSIPPRSARTWPRCSIGSPTPRIVYVSPGEERT